MPKAEDATSKNDTTDHPEEHGPEEHGQQGAADSVAGEIQDTPAEVGGPKGPDPTRFGDWERKGRCIDF